MNVVISKGRIKSFCIIYSYRLTANINRIFRGPKLRNDRRKNIFSAFEDRHKRLTLYFRTGISRHYTGTTAIGNDDRVSFLLGSGLPARITTRVKSLFGAFCPERTALAG